MEQSDQIDKLAKAMVCVQNTDLFALTDSKNPFFNSKYADLSSVWKAIREPLTDNGLCVIQTMEPNDGAVVVCTTLMHESGQWIRGRAKCTPEKATPQSYGSTVTYLRRYGLQAIVGVCPEDDDGNAGEGRTDKIKSGKKPTEPPMTEAQKIQLFDLLKDAGIKKDGERLTLADAKKYGFANATAKEAEQKLADLEQQFAKGDI